MAIPVPDLGTAAALPGVEVGAGVVGGVGVGLVTVTLIGIAVVVLPELSRAIATSVWEADVVVDVSQS